jgi:hypothetical protein
VNPDLEPGALQKGYQPRDAAKLTRAELRVKLDKAENKKVKERSGGRCEVYRRVSGGSMLIHVQCDRSSAPGVHHMIPGRGNRGRGDSALAECKQDVCFECHRLITEKKLKRVGGDKPHYMDPYVLVKL